MTVNKSEKLEIEPDYDSDDVLRNHEKPLNKLLNENHINKPQKSIYLMKMIRNHNITSEKEVLKQIEAHKDGGCNQDNCNQVMKTNINDFVNKMYESQQNMWGFYKYSKSTCEEFLIDLFTRRSINGDTMEKKAIDDLETELDFICVEKASGKVDGDYSVDLVVGTKKVDAFCGVQVKPTSYDFDFDDVDENLPYKKFYKESDDINKRKNEKYDHPVYYLKYEDEEFVNLEDVVDQIEELAIDIMCS